MPQTYAFGTPTYPAGAGALHEEDCTLTSYIWDGIHYRQTWVFGQHCRPESLILLCSLLGYLFFYDFLAFSFIQQNWGDNGCILRNCPWVSFLIYFHHMSHSSCTTLSYFSFPLFFFPRFTMERKISFQWCCVFEPNPGLASFHLTWWRLQITRLLSLCYTGKRDEGNNTT